MMNHEYIVLKQDILQDYFADSDVVCLRFTKKIFN